MSSACPGAIHRKRTRRPGRKATSLRPESNTSLTVGEWVVKMGREGVVRVQGDAVWID